MESYSLKKPANQAEQLNGFWLVTLMLNDEIPFAACLGTFFHFDAAPQIPLTLFQYGQDNTSNSYQFLTQQALPQAVIEHSLELYSDADDVMPHLEPPASPVLILGDGLYMANAFALAKHRSLQTANTVTNVILASETAFPFMVKPARYLMNEMPAEAIGASTLLEDWHIQNRLASQQGLPGCFEGSIDEMFTEWLQAKHYQMQASGEIENWQVVVFSENSVQKKCLQASQSFDWVELVGIFNLKT
ncbi:hypothetical protein THMIRHAM_19000 [Thiomicrorhabdus immobilis]|uniref:Uncharacterized protein n=1 Tax=Thiomicrorhabdus immobilis TaxID=2791037 RepID=A0ABN6CYP6_9GAMM|nr:hypothetical protein [Thiomicrorhabdus immobilis]BCN94115.1 hypothetical protein THMIRHAM_19000 [Thiomicrorhabdus immobilis]